MSAAALAARLRNGPVLGTDAAKWNGWNGCADPVPVQEKQPVPACESLQKQAVAEGKTALGTGGTGGTGVFGCEQTQDTETTPETSAPASDPAPIQPLGPFHVGAGWRPLAADYYRHHFGCMTCMAAGHGRGDRCAGGLALWLAYEAACDLSHPTPTRRNPR